MSHKVQRHIQVKEVKQGTFSLNSRKQAFGTMRSCFATVVVVVVAVASVQSKPQYGGGGGGNTEPECVTKFRDVNEIFQKEEFRNICKPVTK
jgi:hypothetical protein